MVKPCRASHFRSWWRRHAHCGHGRRCYLGARLAAAGEEVTFIARGAHLAAIRRRGLRLTSELGDAHIKRAVATGDPRTVGPVDLVLFTVKLYDAELAAEAAKPLLGPQTGVVTFQNGVDSVGLLTRALGAAHAVGGVAHIPAMVAEPGVIRHTGQLARFAVGELDGRQSERVVGLGRALTAAGVEVTVSARIESAIWEKFVLLAAWSGVSTATRGTIAAVHAHAETRALLAAAIREAAAVATAKDVALAPDCAERTIRFLRDEAPGAAKASQLQDLEAGRRLELPWLSGAVVRFGRELGIPTPTHAFICAALAPYVDGSPRFGSALA
jgi:2-dehydropantoate 2-reductase